MTQHHRPTAGSSTLNRPGALIAALPAVLGFVPRKSLIVVGIGGGELGAVMRVDLGENLLAETPRLAEVLAGGKPEAAIIVIVDDDGSRCSMCGVEFADLAHALADELARHDIAVWAVHVVDRVERGGRWHCVDGCGSCGVVDDPAESALTAAAVFEGRRLYADRADLQAVIAGDDHRGEAITALIAERPHDPGSAEERGRAAVHTALAVIVRVAGGEVPGDDDLAELGAVMTEIIARDILFALAISEHRDTAESLWAQLARVLTGKARVEALALLAFSAYARGDGPLAGIALQEALGADPGHRMSGMLDQALQGGLPPAKIRELADSGYRLAAQLGVQLPGRRREHRRAG